jgi:hypothetical protein
VQASSELTKYSAIGKFGSPETCSVAAKPMRTLLQLCDAIATACGCAMA